jgi:hypothetical protein
MNHVEIYLRTNGPSRSSSVADYLKRSLGLSPDAARKRISRAGKQVRSIAGTLPKKETFLCLEEDQGTPRLQSAFLAALRETGTVYGVAIDGLQARKGCVLRSEFAVISGSADRQKKSVPNDKIIHNLREQNIFWTAEVEGEEFVYLLDPEESLSNVARYQARQRVEAVMLEALKDWLRNLGMVSYEKVAIRGKETDRTIGPFKFDLTAPSYLAPMTGFSSGKFKPGFVVADVFSDIQLDEFHVRFFLKKIASLKTYDKIGKVLPILFAPGFSKEALRLCKEAGAMVATPTNLLGETLSAGLNDLTQTLKNAATVVAKDPNRLATMVERLSDIEGKNLNLRGILFELFVAYLVRDEGHWLEVGSLAKDPKSGKSAEIDVLVDISRRECMAIECKAKVPGGELSVEEVEKWLGRLSIWQSWMKEHQTRREASYSFQIWTTGKISPEALSLLQREKHV